MMHAAILASPDLRTTAKRLTPELDVSPMDNPAVKPLEFTLARSATQFETKKKGLLPPSLVMMGKNTYDVKDYVKNKFPNVDYVEGFPGPDGPKSSIKTAWVLPIAAQTASTGTLADSPHARRDGHRGGSRRGGRRQRRGGQARRQRARRRRS